MYRPSTFSNDFTSDTVREKFFSAPPPPPHHRNRLLAPSPTYPNPGKNGNGIDDDIVKYSHPIFPAIGVFNIYYDFLFFPPLIHIYTRTFTFEVNADTRTHRYRLFTVYKIVLFATCNRKKGLALMYNYLFILIHSQTDRQTEKQIIRLCNNLNLH